MHEHSPCPTYYSPILLTISTGIIEKYKEHVLTLVLYLDYSVSVHHYPLTCLSLNTLLRSDYFLPS